MTGSNRIASDLDTNQATSGPVTVRVGEGRGFRISLDRSRHLHDEDLLIESVETCMKSLREGMIERAVIEVEERGIKTIGRTGDSNDKDDSYQTDNEIVCNARSDSGNTEVLVSGDGDFFIKFRNNIVRRTDMTTKDIEIEINQATNNACKEFSNQQRAMRKKHRRRT